MKKLSEKMIEAYNSGTFGVLVDSFVSDTQKLERESITMKDCNCPQSLGLIELDETRVREIEKLKTCNVRLRAKIGELESKSLCDDETISRLKAENKKMVKYKEALDALLLI